MNLSLSIVKSWLYISLICFVRSFHGQNNVAAAHNFVDLCGPVANRLPCSSPPNLTRNLNSKAFPTAENARAADTCVSEPPARAMYRLADESDQAVDVMR